MANIFQDVASSHSFKHRISFNIEKTTLVCGLCGEDIKGEVLYCPVCNKYYSTKCAINSFGGYICPMCEGLTFLKTVFVKHNKNE